jgi:hypothetical protein
VILSDRRAADPGEWFTEHHPRFGEAHLVAAGTRG